MARRFDWIVRLGWLVGCLAVVAGCRQEPEAGLSTAALQTHARYIRAVNAGTETRSEEIAAKYWTKEIKRLYPVRVYLHRSNVVVVQGESPGRQEGKYISILISSWRPQSGVDGFTFTETGEGVYDFIRKIED